MVNSICGVPLLGSSVGAYGQLSGKVTSEAIKADSPLVGLTDAQKQNVEMAKRLQVLWRENAEALHRLDQAYREAMTALGKEHGQRWKTLFKQISSDHKALARNKGGESERAEMEAGHAKDRKEIKKWREKAYRELNEDHQQKRKSQWEKHYVSLEQLKAEKSAPKPSLPQQQEVEPTPETPTADVARPMAITGYETVKQGTEVCAGGPVTLLGRNLGASAPPGGVWYGQGGSEGHAFPASSYREWPRVELPNDIPRNRRYWLAAKDGTVLTKGPETLRVISCAEVIVPDQAIAKTKPEQYELMFSFHVEILKDCDDRGPGEWQWVAKTAGVLGANGKFHYRWFNTGGNQKLRDGDKRQIGPPNRYVIEKGKAFQVRLDALECDRRWGIGIDPNWDLGQPCPETDERRERGGPHDGAGMYLFTITPSQYMQGAFVAGSPLSNNTQDCKYRRNPPSNLPYKAWIRMLRAKPLSNR